mmetsp:Transcript_32499/g.45068  ORF Transcript_32499/g.45068 Transcript_32499/m.45068 type:complete len:122 (-) Transcript_32499:363-728(-)|eukprot:CAMPEP_0196582160 /NCGR_PEP_ID=MMETSP1081-20130531/37737_1 /TAXON_ID=36882 /ORGANISM="Pyramimonas amylifera, Strain CCMP720" /LENGTH=121 /DNA_ID=CAMNT_0041902647 /DNA_START=185 /DNA_END=550 /DNA_ORIENTATION=-
MATPEVTWEDQNNINSFGKLNNRKHEIRAEHSALKKRAEDFEEASNELMIADEEEVRYVLGECLAHMPNEDAEERLQTVIEEIQSQINGLEAEEADIMKQQTQLKAALYGKFEDNINLEED